MTEADAILLAAVITVVGSVAAPLVSRWLKRRKAATVRESSGEEPQQSLPEMIESLKATGARLAATNAQMAAENAELAEIHRPTPPDRYPRYLHAGEKTPRNFVRGVFPEDLIETLRQLPELSQREVGDSVYKGRWMRFDAVITGIHKAHECYEMSVESTRKYSATHILTFTLDQRPLLDTFRTGDLITVEAQINRVASFLEFVYPTVTRRPPTEQPPPPRRNYYSP